MRFQQTQAAPYWAKKYLLRRKGLVAPQLYKFDEVDLAPKKTLAEEILEKKNRDAEMGHGATKGELNGSSGVNPPATTTATNEATNGSTTHTTTV